jgi:hypothetical protein
MRSPAEISGEVGTGRCFSGPSASLESGPLLSGAVGWGVVRPELHDHRVRRIKSDDSLRVTPKLLGGGRLQRIQRERGEDERERDVFSAPSCLP